MSNNNTDKLGSFNGSLSVNCAAIAPPLPPPMVPPTWVVMWAKPPLGNGSMAVTILALPTNSTSTIIIWIMVLHTTMVASYAHQHQRHHHLNHASAGLAHLHLLQSPPPNAMLNPTSLHKPCHQSDSVWWGCDQAALDLQGCQYQQYCRWFLLQIWSHGSNDQ